MSALSDAFSENFFFNEVNSMAGSGGEHLIKGEDNKDSPATLIEVGDYFIGIGATHAIECLSRNPSPEAIHFINQPAKAAMRAFRIVDKVKGNNMFDFVVDALSPSDYSALMNKVSDGVVNISPDTIPEGTMILSFLDNAPTYTMDQTADSPAANWKGTTKGERHWNVGKGKPDDFWMASLPFDDYSLLNEIDPWTKVGSIKFGLSYLDGSEGRPNVKLSTNVGPTGTPTEHELCFTGAVVGKKGLNTPFPIVMKTEIMFRPVR